MIVTATEFKNNLGKYLEMATSRDIFIAKNEKSIARLTSFLYAPKGVTVRAKSKRAD